MSDSKYTPASRDVAMRESDSDEEESDEEVSLSPAEQHKQRVVAFKSNILLQNMVSVGSVPVDRDSVYGSVLVLPQVARSCGWKRTFTTLTVRNYMNLFFNFLLQGTLLYMVTLESRVMNPLGGQMHLCSYANHLSSCQKESCTGDVTSEECQDLESDNCVGPGGTRYNKNNLLANYDVWAARLFFRDSLLKLFPGQAEDISSIVDPGEYGMESRVCRWVCMLLFVMAIIRDLTSTIGLIYLLRHVPTKAESWIELEEAGGDSGSSGLKFKVAGMPQRWKVVNYVAIVIPKLMLWVFTVNAGIRFLMETAGVVDLILNSVAMGFILDIDELIADRLSNDATKHVMAEIEDFQLYDADEILAGEPTLEELDEFDRKEAGSSPLTDPWFWLLIFPRRLLIITAVAVVFYLIYFYENCQVTEDGSYVSKPLYLPVTTMINPLNIFIAPFSAFIPGGVVQKEPTPVWSAPNA